MKNKLWQIIDAVIDMPVIWGFQSGVKPPPEPYITVYILKRDVKQPVHRTVLDSDGNRVIEAHRTAWVQIDCYGANSAYTLEEIEIRLHSIAALDLCDQLNVSFSDFEEIKEVPVPKRARYQERSVFRCDFNYITRVTETLPIIEQVNLDKEYRNG